MGAHNFEHYQYGSTPEEAFRDAQDEARYEYGHQPYNGTISTVSGFVHIPLKEGESEGEWAARILDDPRVQKWEDCAYRVDEKEPDENGRRLYIFAGWAAC
jgi:hypothetical protein